MPRASRLPAAALLAAGLALAAGEVEAGGDTVHGTRSGAMSERAHRIDLRFTPGYATAVVRRTVHNASARADEAVYAILLPQGAVATRLRLQARGGSSWPVGGSLAAREAADRYHWSTGFDGHGRRGPDDAALLSWAAFGGLSLRVFPVAAGRYRTVEYTLELPATWIDGRWVIELEDIGLDGSPAELYVRPVDRADRLYVDGEAVRPGHRVVLDEPHAIALEPHAPPAVALELASLAVSRERALAHWRLSLGRGLAAIPRNAHVVVALDASRSLAVGVDEAQRRAALAYLEHFHAAGSAARVAVLTFDRRVHRVSDGWVSVARAREIIADATLTRDNGSDVALALHEARALFADAPANAPRRVLLLTDFMTASSRPFAAHEAAAVDTGAIVHLAAVADDALALTRDDRHLWAAVAARTGGVVWQAAVASDGDPDARADAVVLFEEWARPLRIDSLRVELGRPDRVAASPASLAVGEGIEAQLLLDRPVDQISVRGLTWNIPFVHTARRSVPLSRRWAALWFATAASAELTADEGLGLARRGGAVTPWTSHLLAGPAAAPSREGFEREALGSGGRPGKGGGGGTGTGYGRSRGAGFRGRLDRQTWLESQVVARWLACGGAGRGVELELDTTYDELVDFSVRGPGSAALVACMHESTWALRLPTGDFVDPRARWTVVVPPAHLARK